MSDRKAVIKNADMAEDMQQDAIDCATQEQASSSNGAASVKKLVEDYEHSLRLQAGEPLQTSTPSLKTSEDQMEEKRFAEDGEAYTYAEFVSFFGETDGKAYWEAAEAITSSIGEPTTTTSIDDEPTTTAMSTEACSNCGYVFECAGNFCNSCGAKRENPALFTPKAAQVVPTQATESGVAGLFGEQPAVATAPPTGVAGLFGSPPAETTSEVSRQRQEVGSGPEFLDVDVDEFVGARTSTLYNTVVDSRPRRNESSGVPTRTLSGCVTLRGLRLQLLLALLVVLLAFGTGYFVRLQSVKVPRLTAEETKKLKDLEKRLSSDKKETANKFEEMAKEQKANSAAVAQHIEERLRRAAAKVTTYLRNRSDVGQTDSEVQVAAASQAQLDLDNLRTAHADEKQQMASAAEELRSKVSELQKQLDESSSNGAQQNEEVASLQEELDKVSKKIDSEISARQKSDAKRLEKKKRQKKLLEEAEKHLAALRATQAGHRRDLMREP